MTHQKVRQLSGWERKFKYPLLFAWSHRKATWWAILIFMMLYSIALFLLDDPQKSQPSLTMSLHENWFNISNHINLFLQLLTLIVIIFVWFAQLQQDWKNSLDKFLSVTFEYKGKIYDQLSAQYAPFFSEADIRLLGQSMGQVRNNGERLPLDSENNVLSKSISIDPTGQICPQPFWHYEITMPLLESLPEPNKELSGFIDKVSIGLNRIEKSMEQDKQQRLAQIMKEISRILDSGENKKRVNEQQAQNCD